MHILLDEDVIMFRTFVSMSRIKFHMKFQVSFH
jgi:hypothetical protein